MVLSVSRLRSFSNVSGEYKEAEEGWIDDSRQDEPLRASLLCQLLPELRNLCSPALCPFLVSK
ncbi:unnamed protein product [Gulo gulo]|uniref:Uncharacterized protein n=1 Tax=Gulo gulo TaxID=48420 RepID=A0A9X9PT84_GULGU|nr:unnamed protein product [Gulo gulo]